MAEVSLDGARMLAIQRLKDDNDMLRTKNERLFLENGELANTLGAENLRLRAENARLREGSAMSDEFYPVPPHSTRRLECLPAGEIGALRAEIKRLRADNERLRAALKKIASRDWQDPFDYIDLARTALRET